MTDSNLSCHCANGIARTPGGPRGREDGGARPAAHTVRRAFARAVFVGLWIPVSGCDATVDIGARFCPEAPQWPGDSGATPNPDASVGLPWSTGFEYGFCEYEHPLGFCYSSGEASYSLVTSPVHSGRYAAAFTVNADSDGGETQTRCVQQGVFPDAAYYGAWYYIPTPTQSDGSWNLLFFQGGLPENRHGLWNVSLVSLADGGLQTSFDDLLLQTTFDTSALPPLPIGRWFHIEVYFKRAMSGTGALSLWQDDMMAFERTGIETDDTDWGQWYVGNLAVALSPAVSTVYVDDVTIVAAP